MTKLIALLAGGIPAIIASIIAFVGRKFGMAAATVTTMVFLTATMIACINVILNTILWLLTIPPWLLNAVGALVPSTFTAVLSAIISARTCRAAYDLAMGKVKAINNAN